jgi:acyl carrier protein
MEEKEILKQVNDIFSALLRKNDLQLTNETTAADVDGWDSLSHMILMSNIEKQFSIKFKLNEIMKFNNIGDMIICIHKKMNSK